MCMFVYGSCLMCVYIDKYVYMVRKRDLFTRKTTTHTQYTHKHKHKHKNKRKHKQATHAKRKTPLTKKLFWQVLTWLRENGCEWDHTTCTFAAQHNHFHILKWAKESGCEWNANVCDYAALNGNLQMLQWARANG